MKKNKKQSVVSRSSVESEYRAMENMTCELAWIRGLFTKLDFASECPMRLYCDNLVVIRAVENLVFHERTEHIKVNCHLVRQKIEEKILLVRHVLS